MKTVKELLEPVTSRGLDLMVLVDTWDFQRFYESEEFFDKLKTGVGLQEGSSILTLQENLLQMEIVEKNLPQKIKQFYWQLLGIYLFKVKLVHSISKKNFLS